ncbi:MAG TPA: ribonuclease Z [Gemmatimonadales bacterium]|nr:ribonuclease Z [Gemmatimonadales bacterium]
MPDAFRIFRLSFHQNRLLMRLTTIGTGTVSPHSSRVSAAHLVEVGDARILFDCGGGAMHRMAHLGIRWQDITHVALSHFHADHISDLPLLMLAWRYGQLPPRSEPLSIIGPPGTSELMTNLASAFGEWVLDPGYPFSITELPPGDTAEPVNDVQLRARSVPHTAESVAYSVEHDGRRLVYTGDTGYEEELGTWASECDILLTECSLPAAMGLPTHLTPEECGSLAAIARPSHLVLTHFYPPVETVDIAAIVAERFTGRITLATDGWTTEF